MRGGVCVVSAPPTRVRTNGHPLRPAVTEHTVIRSERRWVHIITPPAEPRASAWTNRWPARTSISPALEWRGCVCLNGLLRWDQSELLSPQATSSNLSLGVTPRSCFVVACVVEKRFCRLARFWYVWLICACFLKLIWRVLEWTLNTERVILVSPAAQSTIIDRSADIHTTDRRSDISTLAPLSACHQPSHRCEWKSTKARGIYVSKCAVVMLQVEMITFVGVILWMCVFSQEPSSKVMADRYAVYWNRTNPRWADRSDYIRTLYTRHFHFAFIEILTCKRV